MSGNLPHQDALQAPTVGSSRPQVVRKSSASCPVVFPALIPPLSPVITYVIQDRAYCIYEKLHLL